ISQTGNTRAHDMVPSMLLPTTWAVFAMPIATVITTHQGTGYCDRRDGSAPTRLAHRTIGDRRCALVLDTNAETTTWRCSAFGWLICRRRAFRFSCCFWPLATR